MLLKAKSKGYCVVLFVFSPPLYFADDNFYGVTKQWVREKLNDISLVRTPWPNTTANLLLPQLKSFGKPTL